MPKGIPGSHTACTVEGCGRPALARGLCRRHYQQWAKQAADRPRCSVEGCARPAIARGWCTQHHDRWQRTGDPLALSVRDERRLQWLRELVASVEETGDDSCRTDWPFARKGRSSDEYPRIGRHYAHAIVLQLTGRPRPSRRHQARHLCGNGRLGCLNPRHLAWGTAAQNEADKLAHGTSNRGERHGMVKLTEAAVREIRRSTDSDRAIARRYGVTAAHVARIRQRKSWAWLD